MPDSRELTVDLKLAQPALVPLLTCPLTLVMCLLFLGSKKQRLELMTTSHGWHKEQIRLYSTRNIVLGT